MPRGYADRAPIKLMSRIDSVDGLGTLTRSADGTAAIGGVAWAQTRGISNVEVQIDDGRLDARRAGRRPQRRHLAAVGLPLDAGRASDRIVDPLLGPPTETGVIQTDERSEPLPDGASGHHQIVVFVE